MSLARLFPCWFSWPIWFLHWLLSALLLHCRLLSPCRFAISKRDSALSGTIYTLQQNYCMMDYCLHSLDYYNHFFVLFFLQYVSRLLCICLLGITSYNQESCYHQVISTPTIIKFDIEFIIFLNIYTSTLTLYIFILYLYSKIHLQMCSRKLIIILIL